MNLTKIDTRNFKKTDLNIYTTLIIPSCNTDNSSSKCTDFDYAISKKIKNWVKSGGTLITYKNSIDLLKESKLLNFKRLKNKIIAKNISFEEKTSFTGAQQIGGAIFNTEIDRSHPINFGQTNKTMPIFRNSTIFLEKDEESYNNPILYTKNPLMSGYISEENIELLKSSSPLKINSLGDGKVIYLTDNTNFRAFWYGTNKILMNAIFFSKIM